MKKWVLSERKTKAAAALAGKSFAQVGREAGYTGPNADYPYRILKRGDCSLSTAGRLALAIPANLCDLLELVDVDERAEGEA
jgi:hypothetical protein